jgi:hypothetical protein
MKPDLFGFLYQDDGRGISNIGNNYKPPKTFRHGEWELVADMKKDPENGDGQSVKIFECRMPARFYKIEAGSDVNSVGKKNTPFALSTGSGMEILAGEIAKAITQGMLGIHTEE